MSRSKPKKQYWKISIDKYGGAILIHNCKSNIESQYPARFQYMLLSRGEAMCTVCRSTKVPKKIRAAFDVTNQILDEE